MCPINHGAKSFVWGESRKCLVLPRTILPPKSEDIWRTRGAYINCHLFETVYSFDST